MPPINRQSFGVFVGLLETNGASKESVDTLRNINGNYRNPLMHPEDSLDLHEAISLFCVCQAMIEILVAELKKRDLDKNIAKAGT